MYGSVDVRTERSGAVRRPPSSTRPFVRSSTRPRHLGLEKPITYAQSLTLFAQARGDRPRLARGRPARALVLGDLVFSRESRAVAAAATEPLPRGERALLLRDGELPGRLPATGPEARRIAGLYASRPLTGVQGSEATLRRRVGKADVVHLATHGYLNPYRAMSSMLLLTAPEKKPATGEYADDGFLEAWEIQDQLALRAELVVLSACETGRGENVRAEGLVGLTRALQVAGARSVVASTGRWPTRAPRPSWSSSTASCAVEWRRMRRSEERWSRWRSDRAGRTHSTGRRSCCWGTRTTRTWAPLEGKSKDDARARSGSGQLPLPTAWAPASSAQGAPDEHDWGQ